MPRQLSDPLTEDDKVWLRNNNRQAEIPDETPELVDNPGSFSLTNDSSTPGSLSTEEDTEGLDVNPESGDPDGPQADTEPSADAEDEEDAPYSEWTVPELQAELGDRGLPKSGKKDDLVERLEAADRAS